MLTKKQIEELYDSLTFEEKLGELLQLTGSYFGANGEITGQVVDQELTVDEVYHCGSILNTYGAKQLSEIQREHLKHDRVPMIFMGDVTAGYSASQPIPLGQSCSFNPEIVKMLCQSAAEAATADGVSVTFSPMVDICRDARWGRVAESYGEDTYLSSLMSRAAVKGYQGNDSNDASSMSSCVKHFAAYGYPESGIDYTNVELSERTLKGEFLPPYHAAVDAGCDMLMTSFNTIGGVPVAIDKKLQKDLLRDEWGFNGVIITDWNSLLRCININAVHSAKESAYYAAKATTDIDMGDYVYTKNYKQLIDEGIIDESLFRDSVIRVLQLKNKQGILENPYKFLSGRKIDFKKHYDIAKKAVHESCVLLENQDDILPIQKNEKIALIGPYAVVDRAVSMWSQRHRPETASLRKYPKQAFEDILGSEVLCEPGCAILPQDNPLVKEFDIKDACYENPELYIEKALRAAQNVDKVIVMIGEHLEQGGESCSKSDIGLENHQIELLKKIYAVNQNVVTVVYSARPVLLQNVKPYSKAILMAFMPGDAGSEGIAEVLCGIAVPSGKLSMSIPYNVGQCPMRYGLYQDGSDNSFAPKFHRRYLDAPLKPMYPFGYGISYTKFNYSSVKLSNCSLSHNECITASVLVENIGRFDAKEAVQLYLQDITATLVSRPLRELKGVQKVFVKAGQSVTVTFTITEEMLKFYNADVEFVSEPGMHRVYIGGDSSTENSAEFEFVG